MQLHIQLHSQVARADLSHGIPQAIMVAMEGRGERGSGAEDPKRVTLVSPILTAIRERLPVLRWRSFPGTARYSVVLIWKAKGLPSTPITTDQTSLLLEKPLEAEVFYEWEVTALDKDGAVLATSVREEFNTLAPKALRQAAKDAWELDGQHLALSLAYAKQGLREEALREVSLYLIEHPGDQAALKLKAALLKPLEQER